MTTFIEINKKEDLNKLRNLEEYKTYYVCLLKDIDLEGEEFEPICAPTNRIIIKSNEHSIKNLSINSYDNFAGLFSEIDSICVDGLIIENANINGLMYNGIIAGKCNNAVIRSSKIDGELTSKEKSGGLFGEVKNIIVNDCNIDTNIKGLFEVGGIVGNCTDTFKSTNSYIKSTISGKDKLGGLIGVCNYDISVNNCKVDSNVKGKEYTGGIVGKTDNIEVINASVNSEINSSCMIGGIAGQTANSCNINKTTVNATLNGNLYIGGLVGLAINESKAKKLEVNSNIKGKEYIGGLFGCSENLTLNYCTAKLNIDAIDIAGGIVGMTNTFDNDNQLIINGIVKVRGKAQGILYGYNSREMEMTIEDMLKNTLNRLPSYCTEKELGILKRKLLK